MKQFTTDEIFNTLVDTQSLDISDFGDAFYYIHYADGKLVETCSNAEKSFSCYAPYLDNIKSMDEAYDMETRDNPDFMEVVEDLTNQINEYLVEQEVGDKKWKEFIDSVFASIPNKEDSDEKNH